MPATTAGIRVGRGAHALQTITKPDELLALHDVTAELFTTLRAWFDVPDRVGLSLDDIDAAVSELGDPVMIAALAMRKLQALRLLSQPGVRTSTDVVVAIVQDLDRALLQAPSSRLKRAAATADWDAELEGLVADRPGEPTAADPGTPAPDVTVPSDPAGEDPDALRFRELHGRLHEAARAVVAASGGAIAYLV
jgi:hypothetical protein